jgi:hypothetical protein
MLFSSFMGAKAAGLTIPQLSEYSPEAYTRGLWHLDETDGTIAYDSTANGGNGTLVNSPGGWSAATPRDQIGTGNLVGDTGSLSFDGLNDYVRVPSSNALRPAQQLMIEAWIRPGEILDTTLPHGIMTIARKMLQSGDGGGYLIRLMDQESADPYLEFILKVAGSGQPGNQVGLSATGALVPLNTWSHVAGLYDGSKMKTFLNGQEIASKPQSGYIFATDTPLVFGRLAYNYPTEYFHGEMDEIRIGGVGGLYIPEPAKMSLLGLGGLAILRRRRGHGRHRRILS